MSGAMPGELAGAAGGGAGGGKGGGGKGGGGAGGGSPADFSNTGTGLLNNLDPATMGAGTTAGLTGDPTGSLGATAAAAAGGPPLPDMAFGGPPQGTTPTPPTPPVPAPQAQPSLPPIGAPIPDSAFAGPPPFTPGGTPGSQGPTATPGGPSPPPTAGAVTSNQPRFGYGPQGVDVPAPTAGAAADIGEGGGYGPMGPAGGNLSPTLADLSRQTQTALQPRPPMAQPSPEMGWDPQQPFAVPTAGAAPTGDVGGGIQGLPPEDTAASTEPTFATTDVPQDPEQPFPPGRTDVAGTPELPGGAYGGGSPTQQPTQRFDPTTGQSVQAPAPPKVPTGPAQAAPGTTAGGTPASTGPVSSRGQPGPFQAGVNPIKFLGDIFQLAMGNPSPLLGDIAGMAGFGPGNPGGMPPGTATGQPPAGGTAPTGAAGAPAGTQDTSKLPGGPNGPEPKPDDELGQRRKQWYAQNPNAGTFPEDSNAPEGPTRPDPKTGQGQWGNLAQQAQQGASGDYLKQNGASSTLNGVSQKGDLGKLDPNFGDRLAAAGRAYEQETGQKPQYGEGYRDDATQMKYWNKLQGGRLGPVARPQALGGRGSEHEFGRAMDMPDGGFTKWLQQGNAKRFGLGFPVNNDSNHIQMNDLQGRPYPYTPQAGGQPAAATADTGNLSPNLVNRVQQFEGFSARAYPDGSQYSIGYGTRATSPNEVIDQATAQQRLNSELADSQRSVDRFAPNLPQSVRDGLTSLDYNTGSGWQRGPIGQAIRAGDYQRAAQLIQQYHISAPGHVSRRAWEAQQVMGQ